VPLKGKCSFAGNQATVGSGHDIFSDGSVEVTISKESNINALSPIVVQRRPCLAGEECMDGACKQCEPLKYNLEQNSTCKGCPLFGYCPGSVVFAPLSGFWHSGDILRQCKLDDMIR
jgi:hypothetical protein